MKEQKFNTDIGSEIYVTVLFDYEPEQTETAFDEQRDSVVTINKVLVDGNCNKDILEIINAGWIEKLKVECFEYIQFDYTESLE